MHVKVQKLISTTLPRIALLLKGAELSHATPPVNSGINPLKVSSGRDSSALVASCRAGMRGPSPLPELLRPASEIIAVTIRVRRSEILKQDRFIRGYPFDMLLPYWDDLFTRRFANEHR